MSGSARPSNRSHMHLFCWIWGIEADLYLRSSYDVWLGNFRGNKYSSKHLRLKPFDSEYWDFSLDELALIDIPAMIDVCTLWLPYAASLVYIEHNIFNIAFLCWLFARNSSHVCSALLEQNPPIQNRFIYCALCNNHSKECPAQGRCGIYTVFIQAGLFVFWENFFS